MVVIIDERNFFAINFSDIEVHQTCWRLCIRFGVLPMTVLLGFRVIAIADVKDCFARTRGGGICSKLRAVVVNIIIKIISISYAIGRSGFTGTIPVEMNRVEQIFIWICVPGRVINFGLIRIGVMWWGINGRWFVTDNVFGINKFP